LILVIGGRPVSGGNRAGESMSDEPSHVEPELPVNPNAARDHLANERTLLAWIRTCIAIVGLGFVVARFGLAIRDLGSTAPSQTRALSTAFGVTLVVCGAILIIPATLQYLRSGRSIEQNRYQQSYTLDLVLAGGFVLAAGLLAIYLLLTA
jgi:putative membrane protein